MFLSFLFSSHRTGEGNCLTFTLNGLDVAAAGVRLQHGSVLFI
jgi:hypothetical protein